MKPGLLARPEIACYGRKKLRGKSWSIVCDNTVENGACDLSGQRIFLPTVSGLQEEWTRVFPDTPAPFSFGTVWEEIRRHELIHAAISPRVVPLDGLNPQAVQLAEDAAVELFARRMRRPMTELAKLREMFSLKLARSYPDGSPRRLANFAYTVVALLIQGKNDVPEVQDALGGVYHESIIARNLFSGVPFKPTRKQIRELAESLDRHFFPRQEEPPREPQEEFEEIDFDSGWIGPMEIIRLALGDRIGLARSQSPRAKTEGMVPRYPSRFYTSGKMFARQGPRLKPDAFLVDVSSSMGWNIPALVSTLQELSPRGFVACYAGFRHSPRGSAFTVVADKGRKMKPGQPIKYLNGTNACDGPALLELGKLKGYGRKFWISDGGVNGTEKAVGRNLRAQVDRICRAYSIERIEPSELNAFLLAERRNKLKR